MSKPLIALQVSAPTLPGARATHGHAALARAPARGGKGTERARPEEPSPSITAENSAKAPSVPQAPSAAGAAQRLTAPQGEEPGGGHEPWGKAGSLLLGQGQALGGNMPAPLSVCPLSVCTVPGPSEQPAGQQSAASLLRAVGRLSSSGAGVGQPRCSSGPWGTASPTATCQPPPGLVLPMQSTQPGPSGALRLHSGTTGTRRSGRDAAIRRGAAGTSTREDAGSLPSLLGEAPRGTAPNHAGPARLRFMAPG